MATKRTPKKKAEPAKRPPPRDNIDLLDDMPVMVQMVLGGTTKTMQDISDIGEHSLIELDKEVGDPIDVYVNGKHFARGEVVTVNENFGVRLTEVLGQV